MSGISPWHRYMGDGVMVIEESALAADVGIGVRRAGRRSFKAACLDGCSGIAIELAETIGQQNAAD